ncbi:preprotein translocase subunit YajC [Erysipelothrix sp. HDW6B]|uniref:preprotein translocase subunit YajC n=1 Tax=Erysipelothrix TaxID=1647 RepID=UPI001356F245|nr:MULTISPECIES: preprotein translocase subunit YajC [Erysipelothrix]QIK85331.1 preprotein translocase subunit YajC [Erysipelothrix sp. HDW6B]
MTPMSVVLYSSLTVGVLLVSFAIIYYITTARKIKQQHSRMPDILNELKPGVEIVFAGGFVGKLVSTDDEKIFAKVRLSDNTVVEIAMYSITNILDR